MVVVVGFKNEHDDIIGIIEIEERDFQYLKEEKLKYIYKAQKSASIAGFYTISLDDFYYYLQEQGYEFSIFEDFDSYDGVDYSEEFYV